MVREILRVNSSVLVPFPSNFKLMLGKGIIRR